MILFFLATLALVAFMGGVGFTLWVTAPPIRDDHRQIDRLARRDRAVRHA